MPSARMNLKILLPFKIFAEKADVLRIVAGTSEGSFGLLPHRLDCVAALTPGILTFETETEGEVYVAVDEGILVKTGNQVGVPDTVRAGIAAFVARTGADELMVTSQAFDHAARLRSFEITSKAAVSH